MSERISISFEVEKEDIFDMFKGGCVAEEFDRCLRKTFSFFLWYTNKILDII